MTNQPAPQWEETELSLESTASYKNAYTDVDCHAIFTHSSGRKLVRPAFWDGTGTWRIRFTSPLKQGTWTWKSVCTNRKDAGLHGRTGSIKAVPGCGANPLLVHGLLRMSPGRRNAVHADGSPFFMIADTAWALPFRATVEAVTEYARVRHSQGFNAALLMVIQPDKFAEGPRSRTEFTGFDVAFEDLATGHITLINNAYFRYLDTLITTLVSHGIVPVYQPVFHGYGWKGKQVAGNDISGPEYARFCRYLVARYGARPAMYLVSADAFGNAKGVGPGGAEIEKWDAYGQPTGIHYNPWSHNHEFQSVKWLDFQWCQTGHAGEHRHEKVAEMRLNKPVRAVANGEPSYERICRPDRATGWWQGHEQWCNLMAGGTMGVVYGAGGIWQWKLDANEPGWEEWCNTAASWKDALSFEGARYVGRMGQVFDGLPFADMEPRIDLAMGKRCVGIEGRFCVIYLEEGGGAPVARGKKEMPYRWFDPMNGTWLDGGTVEKGAGFHHVNAPEGRPLVLVVGRS